MLKTPETYLRDIVGCEAAIVVRLDLHAADSQRLKSLGLFEGQRIVVQRSGNPVIVSAAGARIAVARELAAHIVVRAADDEMP